MKALFATLILLSFASAAHAVSTPADGSVDAVKEFTAYNPGHCASDPTGGGHTDSVGKHDPSKHTLEDAEAGKSTFAEVATAPMGTGGTAPLRDKCFKLKGSGPDEAKIENIIFYAGDSYAAQKDQANVQAAIGKTVIKDGAQTLDLAQTCGNTKPPQITNMSVEAADCPQEVENKDSGGGGGSGAKSGGDSST
jgi:hypothetical protein